MPGKTSETTLAKGLTKPSVFKRANFCNFSLLMMTLAWVETSNKIDKSHLSDPWLV